MGCLQWTGNVSAHSGLGPQSQNGVVGSWEEGGGGAKRVTSAVVPAFSFGENSSGSSRRAGRRRELSVHVLMALLCIN